MVSRNRAKSRSFIINPTSPWLAGLEKDVLATKQAFLGLGKIHSQGSVMDIGL